MKMKETPLLRFWRAVDAMRAEFGAPPMSFQDVMHWWGAICVEAHHQAQLLPVECRRTVALDPLRGAH